jgi:hypothetical protein
MAITVNGLQIDDNIKYVVSEINQHRAPTRDVQSQQLSRTAGSKLLSNEWIEKQIDIKGYIFGTTSADFQTNMDTFKQNVALRSVALTIDNRTYTSTLTDLQIDTQFYNNTYVPYQASFLCVNPFAYMTGVTASGIVGTNITTYSGSLTISGSAFNQPTLTIIPTGGLAGNSGIKAVTVTYVPTGETLTVSGTFNYASAVVIDYLNYLVTNSGISTDYSGIFSRWDVGVDAFTITIASGTLGAYNYFFSYQPRYY